MVQQTRVYQKPVCPSSAQVEEQPTKRETMVYQRPVFPSFAQVALVRAEQQATDQMAQQAMVYQQPVFPSFA